MLENALFVHTIVYMVELTVTGWCITTICIAISDSFELNTRFLTFYCDPYFLFQILMFLNIIYIMFYWKIYFTVHVQEVLEKTRQLDERYATVKTQRHHKKDKPESSDNSASSRQNVSRWLDLAEMQDELKERISEEQVDRFVLYYVTIHIYSNNHLLKTLYKLSQYF